MKKAKRDLKNLDKRTVIIYSTVFTVTVIFFLSSALYYRYLISGLPSLNALDTYEPLQTTSIYSNDGQLVHELSKQKRTLIPFNKIPKDMINSFVAIEDHRFYEHWGIDSYRFAKVVWVNILAMGYEQGFSTITMQLARQIYLNRERNITRKLREIILALQIEKKYSKQEILEMHLNNEHFGHGAYGLYEAAKIFFEKDVEDLTLDECALLAGVLNGPGRFSPRLHPDRALRRRNLVLRNMLTHGYISRTQYEAARQKPIDVKIVLNANLIKEENAIAPYFIEHVRLQLEDMQEQYGFDLYKDGLTVYTSLDTRAQAIAERAVQERLEEQQKIADQRMRSRSRRIDYLEFKGYEQEEIEELIENEAFMDSLLAEDNVVQSAFISMDLQTGYVMAFIGGKDFSKYKFNRAIQAKRQPGSVFKPFIYSVAIDNGYPVTHQLLNQDVVIPQPDGTSWRPTNYDGSRSGWTTLREALQRSLNLISVRLIQQHVPPQEVITVAKKMGITTSLAAVDALALGSSDVIPIEIVSAYSAFPNKGIKVDPIFITRIEDRFGNTIYENSQTIKREVLSEETAYIMTDLLKSVMAVGTGKNARNVYGFKRPSAGKTGTTNEWTDAWFIGFTPQIVSGVWVGHDTPAISLGSRQSGTVVALPIWANYMKAVHDSLALPVRDFEKPETVVTLRICDDTKNLAQRYCPKPIEEIFNIKYQPEKMCQEHKFYSRRRK